MEETFCTVALNVTDYVQNIELKVDGKGISMALVNYLYKDSIFFK